MIDLDDLKKQSGIAVIVIALTFLVVSGIAMGITHYVLEQTETALLTTDCVIPDNTLVSSCQDLFDLALYPFLGLRSVLVWANYFIIFGVVLGLLMLGYNSGKNPIYLGLLIIFVILLVYGSIEISNVYRTLLENSYFRDIMLDFTAYSRIMLGFPWFTFIVSLASVLLGIVNYQKIKVNSASSAEELDF